MIDYNVYTNIGDRENNEDSCDVYVNSNNYCMVVCDGLGGHSNGEIASGEALQAVKEGFADNSEINEENMASLIQKAQERVIKCQKDNVLYKDIKTTITCVLANENTMIAGHVGDSRIYVFRNKRIVHQSADHSVTYALYKSGRIKEKQIRNHEDRNIVIRTLGMKWDEPKYEINMVNLEQGDVILLCTDGFWENILEKEMLKSMKKVSKASEWMENMLSVLQKRLKEGTDNYTAICALIDL